MVRFQRSLSIQQLSFHCRKKPLRMNRGSGRIATTGVVLDNADDMDLSEEDWWTTSSTGLLRPGIVLGLPKVNDSRVFRTSQPGTRYHLTKFNVVGSPVYLVAQRFCDAASHLIHDIHAA